jgi:tripartite-type tricarboxylate transporter receptor subunit TctC
MLKRFLATLALATMSMIPLTASAANFVLWHAGTAGGISHNLGVMLKARIESTTEHTVQNRYLPGDGGWLAVRQFVDNGPDNSIHLLVQNADKLLMGELMHRVNGHEKFKQLSPVASLGENFYIILVGTNVKANNIKELDFAGLTAITTGSVGAGSFGHLVEHTIGKHIKTPTVSVFYKGGRLALTDLIGNHIAMYSSWPDGIETATKGLTKAIAVSKPRPEFPGVKTLAEQGVTGIPDVSTWVLVKNQHLTPEQEKLTQDLLNNLFNDAAFKKEWEEKIKSENPSGDLTKLTPWWANLRSTYQKLDISPAYAGFKRAVAESKN